MTTYFLIYKLLIIETKYVTIFGTGYKKFFLLKLKHIIIEKTHSGYSVE